MDFILAIVALEAGPALDRLPLLNGLVDRAAALAAEYDCDRISAGHK
jgi:hypothetical protein